MAVMEVTCVKRPRSSFCLSSSSKVFIRSSAFSSSSADGPVSYRSNPPSQMGQSQRRPSSAAARSSSKAADMLAVRMSRRASLWRRPRAAWAEKPLRVTSAMSTSVTASTPPTRSLSRNSRPSPPCPNHFTLNKAKGQQRGRQGRPGNPCGDGPAGAECLEELLDSGLPPDVLLDFVHVAALVAQPLDLLRVVHAVPVPARQAQVKVRPGGELQDLSE